MWAVFICAVHKNTPRPPPKKTFVAISPGTEIHPIRLYVMKLYKRLNGRNDRHNVKKIKIAFAKVGHKYSPPFVVKCPD